MGANRMSFGSDLVGCFKTFNRIKPKMYMTWLGPDGPTGACFATKHFSFSLVTYGVHGMVQQQ
jgi:hypothetical protein